MARHLQKYGDSANDFSIGIWEYYHNGRASQRIAQFAKLYEHFGRLDLSGNAFPLPLSNSYSYRSTWEPAEAGVGHVFTKGLTSLHRKACRYAAPALA